MLKKSLSAIAAIMITMGPSIGYTASVTSSRPIMWQYKLPALIQLIDYDLKDEAPEHPDDLLQQRDSLVNERAILQIRQSSLQVRISEKNDFLYNCPESISDVIISPTKEGIAYLQERLLQGATEDLECFSAIKKVATDSMISVDYLKRIAMLDQAIARNERINSANNVREIQDYLPGGKLCTDDDYTQRQLDLRVEHMDKYAQANLDLADANNRFDSSNSTLDSFLVFSLYLDSIQTE